MAVYSVRSGRDLVWGATLVVGIVDFVDRLVMSILEDCELALMGVETAQTGVMRLFR
jgi:hypothetical protein